MARNGCKRLLNSQFKRGLTLLLLIPLLTACGSASEDADGVANEDVEANSSSGEALPSSETLPLGISVVSHEPEHFVLLLAEAFNIRGEGSCNIAISQVIESSGDFLELEADDSGTVSQARLVAAPTNGSEVPCAMEAVFEEVPAKALSYTVRQSGGDKAEGRITRVSGEDLKRDGYKVVIYPKIDPKIGLGN